MSLVRPFVRPLVRPLFRGLVSASLWDADALNYITRVEIADGQSLEDEVKKVINNFFISLKASPAPIASTNWDAILEGTALLMAGPRTLAGALEPLHPSMPTPTNVNFVQGDYNRVTGLKGGGTIKWIDSNFFDTLPKEDISFSAFAEISSEEVGVLCGMNSGGSPGMLRVNSTTSVMQSYLRDGNTHPEIAISLPSTSFFGGSRVGSIKRNRGAGMNINQTVTATVEPSILNQFRIHGWRNGNTSDLSSARISFASCGRAIDLASADADLTAYMAALNTALS